jgi:hypothetical protein
MSRRALALGVPFVLIALLGSACRAIVGITDLSVDGGADATEDRARSDSGDARSDRVDARGDGADASLDAREDRGDAGDASDGGDGSDATDARDARPVNCDAEAPSEASLGRIGCLQGCVDGHMLAAGAFYGAAPACICKKCAAACEAFCSPACPTLTPTGECNDCATHAYVDDGGACHSVEDTTCKAGCGQFAMCAASCPPE